MKRFIRYTSVYLKNAAVRLNVAHLFGLMLNACYIVFNFVSGIIYGDAWFIAVGAYYFLIFSVRFLLIRGEGDSAETAGTAGILMLVLGVPITGMIIYNVITNGNREYGRATLTVFLIYTVYSLLRAFFGIKSSKKMKNSSHRALHTLRLSAALMSLFNFETSLLAILDIGEGFELFLNFSVGAAVSLSVFALARKTVQDK